MERQLGQSTEMLAASRLFGFGLGGLVLLGRLTFVLPLCSLRGEAFWALMALGGESEEGFEATEEALSVS